MKAVILKFSELSPELENRLENFMYQKMQELFSEQEQEKNMIQDEDEATLVAFVDEDQHKKLNQLVGAIKFFSNSVIEKYEDVTDKFLYQNDFSDYSKESNKINEFVKMHLDTDAVLEKITNLGIDKLTNVDRSILESS